MSSEVQKSLGYDVIVVGAGIEGSATAYTLVKEGRRVLLLEQFPLPHSRGSSTGHSRVTRYAYEQVGVCVCVCACTVRPLPHHALRL